MKNDMESLLRSTKQGLDKDKRADIEALAVSKEGRKVSKMLGGDIEKLVKAGDAEALREKLKGVLSTPEGAELFRKIGEIMK